MLWRIKWVILWSLWAGRVVRQPTAPVKVSNGWVRGTIKNSGSYKQYTGIPYATIVNRFQAPGLEPMWDGVFEADRENIQCIQLKQHFSVDESDLSTAGQEDCLVINVYTPVITSDKPLPVMVFIHGGAFIEGSSSKLFYGPEYLTTKGVVLVTFNYRLGVEGFLSLGIKEAPGNAGMKDQVAALRWVQRNIRAFGGDPDNVTLFGESAGSGSVSLHVVSPMSKGLFHRTIQQSGSSIACWAIQHNPVEKAEIKAKAAGYTGRPLDPYELYKFFNRKSPAHFITHLTQRTLGNIPQSRVLFTPCIEKKFDGVEPFLTESPHKILSEGKYNKVPMIVGSNSDEGLLFISVEPDDHMPNLQLEVAMPKNMEFTTPEEKRKIAEEVKKMYMGDEEISVKTKGKISKHYGEPFFNYPAIEESELIVKTNKNPVYNYYFKYDGWRNIAKWLRCTGSLKGVGGATHADELFYLFSQDVVPSLFESRMIQVMSTMWTNFAKFGDPTPEVSNLLPVRWPPLGPEQKLSLVIDKQLTIGPLWYDNKTLTYWKNAFAKYRRKM